MASEIILGRNRRSSETKGKIDMMIQCPNCQSADLQSNKFDHLVSFHDVAGGALAARRTGHPAHALSLLLVWGGVELANRMRADWKCHNCGHVF